MNEHSSISQTSARRCSIALVATVVALGAALVSLSSAQAQVSISNDGVTFPDDTEQTSRGVESFGTGNTRGGTDALPIPLRIGMAGETITRNGGAD